MFAPCLRGGRGCVFPFFDDPHAVGWAAGGGGGGAGAGCCVFGGAGFGAGAAAGVVGLCPPFEASSAAFFSLSKMLCATISSDTIPIPATTTRTITSHFFSAAFFMRETPHLSSGSA